MRILKNLLLAYVMLISASVTFSQTCATTEGVTTCHYNIPDDGHVIVPIPFGFPFYGQVFTHSIMFDNGAVSFYSPTQPQRWGGAGFGMININESISSSFYYTIMPLRTDLIANGGTHFTQGNENFFTYNWNDVSEFGRWNSRNTFSLEIRPSGYIGLHYDKIDIQGSWTSAIIGDASLGQFELIQNQPNWGVPTTSIDNWSINGTIDCSNPLNDSSCPGYDVAYFNQQCSLNSLYSPGCPGYTTAYALTYDLGSSTTVFEPVIVSEVVKTISVQETAVQVETTSIAEIITAQETATQVEVVVVQETVDIRDMDSNVVQDLVNNLLLANQEKTLDMEVDLNEDGENLTSLESLLSSSTTTPQTTPTASSNDREPTNSRPTTTREAIAQQRQAAAREQAAQEARKDPEGTAEAMDSAESMEQQVELQNVVLGAMSFVPGFDAYGRVILPDASGYAPFEIYQGQQNIDTPAARRLLGGSDRLHQEMIDAQYR